MGALLIFSAIEEPPLVRAQGPDLVEVRTNSVHRPGVGVQIVLYSYFLLYGRGDVNNFRYRRGNPVHIILGESNLHAGFLSTRLLARTPWKDSDDVRAPL